MKNASWSVHHSAEGFVEGMEKYCETRETTVIVEDGAPTTVIVPLVIFENLVQGVEKLIARDLSDVDEFERGLTEQKGPEKKVHWRQVKRVLEEARDAVGRIGGEE